MILEYGKEIVAYGQEYQEAYVSFERIKSILEIKEQSKGCIRLNEIKQIRIQDLNFAYDQKRNHKKFFYKLKKGESLWIERRKRIVGKVHLLNFNGYVCR